MGLQRQEPLARAQAVVELRLRQGGAPGRGLLLLHPRPRVRARLHQDLHLLPLPGQGVAATATSGPSARPAEPGIAVHASWPTASPPATSPRRSRPSATASAPMTSRASSTAGPRAIPTPFTAEDAAAGYFWELSMRQVEVSPHPGLRRPPPGPGLLRGPRGRQHRHRPARRGPHGLRPPGPQADHSDPFRTRVFCPAPRCKMDFSYKHSRVKQYLKEGRALRIETVINKPERPRTSSPGSSTCPSSSPRPAQVNDRLLMIERAGQGCAIGSALFERIHQPYVQGGPTNRSLALRGSTRHGPGRRTLPRRPRRHRLHQQEPSRAGRRTPRQRLQLAAR